MVTVRLTGQGPFDDDLCGVPDVAVLLVIAIEGAGDDLAVGIVDVLLEGAEVDAADVDDAGGVEGLIRSGGEDFEVIIGLFDEILLFAVDLDDAGVGGERDEFIGRESAHQQ